VEAKYNYNTQFIDNVKCTRSLKITGSSQWI
jgi:hypothetical protein